MTTKKQNKTNEKENREYKAGDDIYLPTSLYLSHGVDDFLGGLCKILKIEEDSNWKWIEVEEEPGTRHDYKHIVENQEKWAKEYGVRRGRKDPDYDFDSNCWASPGDIVDGRVIDHYIF
jgi:hypothetical protein